jgi:DNA-binding IscR family transcriptional regulator
LSYAFEHADFHDEFRDLLAHPRSAELIATRIAALVSKAQLEGTDAPTVQSLAAALRVPAQRIADLTFHLEGAGLLTRVKDALLPSREITALTLADISHAVGGAALTVNRERVSRTRVFEKAATLFSEVDEASMQKLKDISWKDLAATERETQKP